MNVKQFGQELKAARRARGWTRQDLSDKTGVRPFSIYCIEEERADRYPVEACERLTAAVELKAKTKK